MEYLRGLLGILIVVEVILSFSLISSSSGLSGYCLLGTQCSSVQNSVYGEILGIKLSIFGLASFIILFIIYLLAHRKKIHYLFFLAISILGALFAAYFIYLQFFVLKQLCSSCLAIDSIMIAIVIIAFYDYKNKKDY